MKRNMTIALVLMLLCVAITAQAEVPQISDDLFSCAKKAVVYLSSGEYERLVTLLPFSGDAPSASEWQNFAEGNFSTLGGDVQTDYSVAYWTGSCWKLAAARHRAGQRLGGGAGADQRRRLLLLRLSLFHMVGRADRL